MRDARFIAGSCVATPRFPIRLALSNSNCKPDFWERRALRGERRALGVASAFKKNLGKGLNLYIIPVLYK